MNSFERVEMKKIGLAALIHPYDPSDFFQNSWPKKPFVVHNLSQTILPLLDLPWLRSLDHLLTIWPEAISAHLPDVRDECSAIEVESNDKARKLFQNKMALLFNNVHLQSEVLTHWLQALATDLGLPSSTHARCMIYATPDGKGTAAHFDQNINFVLQIRGTKKWWIEPNTSVENPTERFTMGQALDPELSAYTDEKMPTQMSSKKEEIILKPGSLLFVPRGYWHSTEADGEALSLNFTFNQPTWADLLTLALRSRLLQSSAWRELADGVTSQNENVRIRAQAEFDLLLQDLIEDLPNWNAADILSATEGI